MGTDGQGLLLRSDIGPFSGERRSGPRSTWMLYAKTDPGRCHGLDTTLEVIAVVDFFHKLAEAAVLIYLPVIERLLLVVFLKVRCCL